MQKYLMIDLCTDPMPIGWKGSVTLQELELSYQVRAIDLAQNDQKEHWY